MKLIKIITVLFLITSMIFPVITSAEENVEPDQSEKEKIVEPANVKEELAEDENDAIEVLEDSEESKIEPELNTNPENKNEETIKEVETESVNALTVNENDKELQEKDKEEVNQEIEQKETMQSRSANYSVQVVSIQETRTSRLGHLNSSAVRIYKDVTKQSEFTQAGSTNTNEVYYIKSQTVYNNNTYYLVSRSPSSSRGVLGWVKSTDMETHEHKKVDGNPKTLFIKGSGSAYTKAWGGRKNFSFEQLSSMKGQAFSINLTESVGKSIWHRGTINGKTAWIHEDNLTTAAVSKTSRLGHLNSSSVRIYKDVANQSKFTQAGSTNTNEVYYIKSQTVYNKSTYYLISRSPSSTRGVLGWVKSTDMETHEHKKVDGNPKTLFIKGSGSAYTKAWGGRKNFSFEKLSSMKDQAFSINLTERVGKSIWHRGTINGKTAWIHEDNLSNAAVSKTSRLGHLNSSAVRIYKDVTKQSEFTQAGSTNTNEVYYIKSQTAYNNNTYYLVSRSPSSSRGVLGWVKSTDMETHEHKKVDGNPKTLFIKGSGSAYTKAWGGRKNYSFEKLSSLQNQAFSINLTESVGKSIWHRGTINGKTAWIHEDNLTTATVSKTSRLGHLNSSSVRIYTDVAKQKEYTQAGSTNTNEVYYIKLQTVYNKSTYYLLSRSPSSTVGVLGWVKSTDLDTHPHVGVDKTAKAYYFKGSGKAYTKAWGGSKNMNVANLDNLKGQKFAINLTEKVGNNTWYRGNLNGKTAWVHSTHLSITPIETEKTTYTNYSNTLEQALGKQMGQLQQTDIYRNDPAYIHSDYVDLIESGVISSTGNVNLRKSASLKNNDNIAVTVKNGTPITIIEVVDGDVFSGSNKWYKITYNKETLYVHTSLARQNALIAKTTAIVNVRAAANDNSHIFDKVSKGTELTVVKKGDTWHEVRFTTWRNPTKEDVQFYLNPSNNDRFQHFDLTTQVSVTDADLNGFLAGNGTLNEMGNAFNKGSEASSINVLYLISHAFLETGRGKSALSNGSIRVGEISKNKWVSFQPNGTFIAELMANGSWNIKKDASVKESNATNIKQIYNMFGIGAVDSNPDTRGSIRAYQEKWFTPEAAITGGAKFAGERYIYNGNKQNTLYKMRWNPANPGYPQYATDIAWAVKQANLMKIFYAKLEADLIYYELHFDIPKYN